MPRNVSIERSGQTPYRLSEMFEVTISSALVVRLKQLNMLYIAPGRTLYPSAEEAHGQRSLGF